MIYKTHRGARLDLQFYKGKATIDFIISVFNDDDTDFDLTVYDSLHFKVFDKKHGTLLLSLGEDEGEISLASPADNDLYLNVSDVQTFLRVKDYWYECYGIREDSEEELICYGINQTI